MRVLLAHNYYGSEAPSGENQVFELERASLERSGHDVRTFTRHSDELRSQGVVGLVKGALATPWNPFSARALRRVVEEFRPDVVHAHNTFPLLSPAIFSAVGSAARVVTLHNYRLFCPAAVPLRDGRACTECMDARSVLPALRHACYRGSRAATLPVAAGVALHRALGTWERDVDRLIALTEFQRTLMVRSGLPADRVSVKPNFYPGEPRAVPWSLRSDSVVFAGRLSEEKGVRDLIDAWGKWGDDAPMLRILGDGPLRAALETRAATARARRVVFLGQVASSTAEEEIARAKLLVVPSIWFEGFPMVLREAFAFGTPAAVSDIGALGGIVEHGRTGVLFRPGDPASLLAAVRRAWTDGARLAQMGEHARREFESKYSEGANLEALLRAYEGAIAVRRTRAVND